MDNWKYLEPLSTLHRCFFGHMELVLDKRTGDRYFRQWVSKEELSELSDTARLQLDQYLKYLKKPCQSPHGLQVITVQESDSVLSVIFEYCNGLTLYEDLRTRSQPYSRAEAKRVLRQLLSYFQDMEANGGLFHHDIKLENIYMNNRTYKVGGCDLVEMHQETSSQLCGTANYLAPEVHFMMLGVLKRKPVQPYSRKADVYSLGILILEILMPRNYLNLHEEDESFQSLFSGSLLIEQKLAVVRTALQQLSDEKEDPELIRILSFMLRPDPKERCSFSYLYEYFELGKYRLDKLPSYSEINDKLAIFCDPNILKISELRKLFLRRFDHEFCIIQLLFYASKEIFDLAFFNFGPSTMFEMGLRGKLLEVSCALALKGMLYLSNARHALQTGVNIFNIKDLQLYINHQLFSMDAERLKKEIHIDDNSPVKIFLGHLLKTISRQTEAGLKDVYAGLLDYNSMLSTPIQDSDMKFSKNKSYCPLVREDKKLQIDNLLARAYRCLSLFPSFNYLTALFGGHLRLVEDSLKMDETFKFVDSSGEIFKWKEYVTKRHPQLLDKYSFHRISLPVSQS